MSEKQVIENSKNIKNKELFFQYKKTNDIEIRNEIFDTYKYMAEIISKKYINKGIEHDDIYQIACVGLIYAIDRFDITKGFEFTSFATPTILGEIKKYFRDKGWAIKVPRKIQEVSKKVNDSVNILSNNFKRTPSVKEIAEYLNYTQEEVLEALEAGKMYSPQSLDVKYNSNNEDSEVTLKDLISSEDNYFEKLENKDFIKKSLDKLNELEKDIIIQRYFNNKTQTNIAKKLNISQMTVSRIEKKSLEKLKMQIERE